MKKRTKGYLFMLPLTVFVMVFIALFAGLEMLAVLIIGFGSAFLFGYGVMILEDNPNE